MGSSAVVASTIPHAVGAALAARRQRRAQVVMAVFGDGATEEGVYHESLNFAVLHQLPVLFLCENNGLAVHSALGARQAYAITTHASAYGLPVSVCAAGWDPLAVHATVSGAVGRIRREGGPQFVEVRTLRYMEHVGVGEDWHVGYRSAAEADTWKALDPVLHEHALVQRWTAAIAHEVEAAVRFAESSPWPGEADLLSDVD
jgi:pyruvate dehydrogenase E1 component alpha subunit